MIKSNIRLAVASIRSNRLRSLLTMLGIIIGVAGAVTTISLGEGVSQQIKQQVNQVGSDVLTIRPGKVLHNSHGTIANSSLFSSFGAGNLSDKDFAITTQTPDVSLAVPIGVVQGDVGLNGRVLNNSLVVATTAGFPGIVNQKIGYGNFFGPEEESKKVAVIGRHVAEELFKEEAPIGRNIEIRGENFTIMGIFEKFAPDPLNVGTDFNIAVFVPLAAARTINGAQAPIYRILVKPNSPELSMAIQEALRINLKAAHANQEDFTILTQAESSSIAGNIVGLLTVLVTAMAVIALLIGGIGIMNVMLVAVAQRTHEVGIRKAIGATNRQILGQFLAEAIALSLWGGVIGVALAGVANLLLRIFTNLQPVITIPAVVIALVVSILVGVIFGIAPAAQAARKAPIDALRSI